VLTHADYTLGAVAPLLSWRAYARRPCYARHTFSGLAALCRMPKTKLIGRPVPEIWPNLTRTDGLTDTTYQPTGQQPFCQYPAVSWEIMKFMSDVDMPGRVRMGSKCEIFRFFKSGYAHDRNISIFRRRASRVTGNTSIKPDYAGVRQSRDLLHRDRHNVTKNVAAAPCSETA